MGAGGFTFVGIAIASAIAFSLCAQDSKAASVAIVNSGSTNAAGFRIVVPRSGDAELTSAPRRFGPDSGGKAEPRRRKVPDTLVHDLYSDLDAAKPLSSLPAPRCMKSASFGTRLTIEFGADATPDLSCGDGGVAKLKALIRDVRQILELFGAN
jgi:hypothetical protein